MPKSKKKQSPLAASYAQTSQSSGPQWLPTPHMNGLSLKHTEYVGGVVLGENVGAGTPKSQLINPANAEIFPYLSGIATSFERWRGKMRFEFRTTRGTTDTGSIYLAVDTDANDVDPATITEMMRNTIQQSGPIYRNISVEVSCSKWLLVKAVNSTAFAPAGSENLFSCGKFLAAVAGFDQTTSSQFGDFFIHYVIELKEPTSTPNFSISGENRRTRFNAQQFRASANTEPFKEISELVENFVEVAVEEDGKMTFDSAIAGTMNVVSAVTLNNNTDYTDFLSPQFGTLVREVATAFVDNTAFSDATSVLANSAYDFIVNGLDPESTFGLDNATMRYGTAGNWDTSSGGGIAPTIDRDVEIYQTSMVAHDVASSLLASHLGSRQGHVEVAREHRVPFHLLRLLRTGEDYTVGMSNKGYHFAVRREPKTGSYSVKHTGTLPDALVQLIAGITDEQSHLEDWMLTSRKSKL